MEKVVGNGVKVTGWMKTYYGQIVGRTITQVVLAEYEGDTLPVLLLDDGRQVDILSDAEGNGPGHLDIGELPEKKSDER